MGLKSRQKGKRIEREIANLLKTIWPKAARGLTQSRGAIQCDVEGTPFWIEVKGGKNPPKPYKVLLQALKDRYRAWEDSSIAPMRPILIVIRKDHEEPRFYVAVDDGFSIELVEKTLSTLKEYA